ncbi:MAG: hypothetical protein IJX61_00380 [Ruminococcus sp.]|nr:hypothetical protein [Ruminococcus sp.]
MATFFNQATISYNGSVADSNIITGRIIGTLSVTKNALTPIYTRTGDITYVVSITNSGDTAFTGLTMTDNLGAYVFSASEAEIVPLTYVNGTVNYYINGVQQAAPTVTDTSPLSVTGISVPAGGNAIIVYTARPNMYAPIGENAFITKTVAVSGNRLINSVTADETVAHSTAPELTISKALDPVVVTENGTITYTFTIRNYGSTATTLTDNVIFSDSFEPVLNISSVTFNGEAWVLGDDYTYDTSTGVFTSVNGSIAVPAATFSQDETTGVWTAEPGVSTLVITGTIGNI